MRLYLSYLCEYVDLYYIELEAVDARPTGTWGDMYNCGHDLQDVGYQFRYRPGNLMHCTACGNIAHNFLRLKEGAIYSVKNFTVQPNKDDFRMLRFAHFIVDMDEDTIFRRSAVKPDGFAHYPFQLVKFDSLEPTNNKYLIDNALNRTTTTRSGSKTLDFHLANNRGQSVRVTMWGGLGEMLIKKCTRHVGLYPVVLTALFVKLYNNRLYLSSTSSTMIVDDEQIPVLKQFKSDDRYMLELEVSDDTTQTVVVMFDKTAKAVVNAQRVQLWDQMNRVVLEEALDESGSSGTLAGIDEPKAGVLVPLTTTLSVKERHDSDGEESFMADSKTKGSDVGCSSGTGKRRRYARLISYTNSFTFTQF
nr:hypothetical protein [Tanacetum cinerariifolium]